MLQKVSRQAAICNGCVSSAGDFPDPVRYAEILGGYDLSTFPRLDKLALAAIDGALSVEIPRLMAAFDNPF